VLGENIDGCGSTVPIMSVALLMDASLNHKCSESRRGLSTAC
jgi:hypothetical protein